MTVAPPALRYVRLLSKGSHPTCPVANLGKLGEKEVFSFIPNLSCGWIPPKTGTFYGKKRKIRKIRKRNLTFLFHTIQIVTISSGLTEESGGYPLT
jgi:hypothetical protein